MRHFQSLLLLCLFLLSSSSVFAQFGPPQGPPSFNYFFPTEPANQPDNSYNETDYLWSAEPAGFDPSLKETGELLIITTDEFLKDLVPFIRWKRQRGFLVYVETIEDIGNEPTAIKANIRKFYENNNVRYVILIGDHDHVKPHLGSIGNVLGEAADPIYALMDGDIYPDLFISRIPITSNKEMRVVLNKTIRYEKGDETNEVDWYSQAIALGSDEGGGNYYDFNDQGEKVEYQGMKDRTIAHQLAEQLLLAGYTDIAELFDIGGDFVDHEAVAEQLNEGAGLVYYLGHGVEYEWKTSSFSNSDISRLQNFNMTPVIISVACLNGNFQWIEGDSFAETWISAGTEEVGTGAVAIMASTTVQPWTPPTVGIREMISSISTAKYKTIGGIFTNGVIKFLSKKRKQIIETFQSWHIFGDASILLRTKMPSNIYYTIDESFNDLNHFEYTIEEGTAISFIQGPYLLARGKSGEKLSVLKTTLSNEDIILTLTGKDKFAKEIIFKKVGDQFIKI